MASKRTKREAAAILRRIVKLLPITTAQGSYISGHADQLDPDGARKSDSEAKPKPRSREG